MPETIEILLAHRSIRKFTDQSLSEEQLIQIITGAQMASSSSHMQAYSIIRVTEQELRSQLQVLSGDQAYVGQAPEFLVFCADLYRLRAACELRGVQMRNEGPELFLAAAVDAALAAQNAAVAAESLGLGICYIGGIRNNPSEVTRLLELPEQVVPVFGLCIGYPDQTPIVRPRLPIEAVLHMNRYDSGSYSSQLDAYDEQIREYYRERTGGKKQTSWTEEMAAKLSTPQRVHMKEYLRQMEFDL